MHELRRSVAIAPAVWLILPCPAGATEGQPSERETDQSEQLEIPARFGEATRRAAVASECFERSRGVLEGWWGLRDPVTGLIPRRVDDPRWAPADNAADCFPFLVLSARFTKPELIDGLREMMRREVELTTRLGWLPDWYSIPRRQFQYADADLGRIIFGAAEYAKDGLNPLIELDGLEPWSARLRQLLDGIIENLHVESDFGLLPAADTETNGELLQSLTRFYFATGEEKYLELAERIGDAYCLEVLPNGGWLPAHQWDFVKHQAVRDYFSLNDHGNEIVGGLAELFVTVQAKGRESTKRYEEPLKRMFDTLLEKARNEDGIWYGLLKPSTGEVVREGAPDTWGYALSGAVAFGLATGEERYLEAARTALRGIDQDRYLQWGGADAYADSIEGALLLLNRFPEPSGFRWLEKMLPRFYAYQRLPRDAGSGIVEGWYGDGNYARTALMVAFYATQGTYASPWSETVQLGAETREATLHVSLNADEAWSGRLFFDHPRHRDHFNLPWDYPRLNSYPEWFTIDAGELYEVHTISHAGGVAADEGLRLLGLELLAGLPIDLEAGDAVFLTVQLAGEPPFGRERGPADPLAHLAKTAGDPALIAAVDLEGNGEYAGETYRWTKDATISWGVLRDEGAVDGTLWLRWGSKNDRRAGRMVIGEHEIDLEDGGWDGYSWLTVDVPASRWNGTSLLVHVKPPPGAGPAAFISSLRLRENRFSPRPEGPSLKLDAVELEGSWRGQNNIPGYHGHGFRVSNAEGVATDTLHYEHPEDSVSAVPRGTVFVWARGYEGGGGDRSFGVSIGGQRLEPTHRGKWADRFSWQFAGHVELEAPTKELEIYDAGAGHECVDAIWLTTDPFFDPEAQARVEHALFDPSGAGEFLDSVIEKCVERAEASHRRVAAHQDDVARWTAERARLQTRLREALGLEPWPPRTPLDARTVGVLERDGYRVERVIFESRPGFPVTANLYLPESDAYQRHPTVVCPTGHWGLAKTEPEVQARCIGLAKQGYVALTYDPFGQGERDVPGNDHHEYFRSIAVGRNNMSFMVWDTIRAIDYLLERPEVDPDRIACTGCSGGGLNTLYAAAIDERIRVAVPVVYVSTLREFLGTKHSHCPCSHVNGLASFADMGDVVALNAPRPTLLITASQDPSFTPKGAHDAAAQAQGAFSLLGVPEALAVHEVDAPHGYDREMRKAMYGWLALHLKGEGDGEPLPEPELEVEKDLTVLHCFEDGRVPGEWATVRELNQAKARALVVAELLDDEEVQIRLASLLGEIAPARLEEPDAGLLALHCRFHLDGERKPVVFTNGAGPSINGWRRRGANDDGSLIVLFHEGVDDGEHRERVKNFEAQAAEVYVIELRWTRGGADEHVLATNSHLAGDPLLFRYTRAAAEILEFLRGELAAGQELVVVAEGQRVGLAVAIAQVACGSTEHDFQTGAPGGVGLFAHEIAAPDELAWKLLEIADYNRLRELEQQNKEQK